MVCLAVLVCLSSVHARRKVVKAGSVSESVYTDRTYDFSLKLNEGWKYKINPDKNNFRIVMTQKKWEAPAYYQNAEDYTKVPRLVIWCDTTTLGVFPFVDSLVAEEYRSDQKKELMKELEILVNEPGWEPLVPRGRKTKEIAGEKAVHWKGQVSYTMYVSLSSSSKANKRVKGKYGATIVAVKKENTMVLFYMMCEWDYYQRIEAEIMEIVSSLTWIEPESEQ
jgi:hypothetical protein